MSIIYAFTCLARLFYSGGDSNFLSCYFWSCSPNKNMIFVIMSCYYSDTSAEGQTVQFFFYVNLPILFALLVYVSYCIKVRSKQCDATILGPTFTKMSDILPQDLAKSRSHEMRGECLKSLWNLTGTSARMPVKFRSDTFIIRYNLAALGRQDIWRHDVFYLGNIHLKGNGLP